MELPSRKRNRLKDYDYSSNGAYFITICTKDKEKTLSSIVGDGSPVPKLSLQGTIVDSLIHNITTKYPSVHVLHAVIMPNHIHLLLRIDNACISNIETPSPAIGTVIGWLKYSATKQINEVRHTPGSPVFQRSFHDHVIRNETDLQTIWDYIEYNPIRWKEDCFYSP